jgi:hypothetical protein
MALTIPGLWIARMLNKGRGYWIKVSQGCTLTYDTNTYGLDADWNVEATASLGKQGIS